MYNIKLIFEVEKKKKTSLFEVDETFSRLRKVSTETRRERETFYTRIYDIEKYLKYTFNDLRYLKLTISLKYQDRYYIINFLSISSKF